MPKNQSPNWKPDNQLSVWLERQKTKRSTQNDPRAPMFGMSGSARVFLCHRATNLRKSFEGLSKIVVEEFKENLISHSYYVFINKQRTLMKVLYFDGDGLAIWAKRLEKGRYPKAKHEQLVIERKDFFMMLEGIVPKRLHKRYRIEKNSK